MVFYNSQRNENNKKIVSFVTHLIVKTFEFLFFVCSQRTRCLFFWPDENNKVQVEEMRIIQNVSIANPNADGSTLKHTNKKIHFHQLIGIGNFFIAVKLWELLPYVNNLATPTSNVSLKMEKIASLFYICV